MGKYVMVAVLLLVLLNSASAQTSEDFALRLEKVAGTTVRVVGSWTIDGVQGWSWGVCHNAAEASIGSCSGAVTGVPASNPCNSPSCPDVACPTPMKNPGPNSEVAAFHSISIFANGITQGVVLDFFQTWELAKTDRFEMMDITYTCKAGAGSANLAFCDTLGNPPVETIMVVGGQGYAPALRQGTSIECGGGECPALRLALAKKDESTVGVVLDAAEGGGVSGFQFGLRHDSANVKITDMLPGSAFTQAGIDVRQEGFWGLAIIDGVGATLGVAVDLEATGGQFLALPACEAGQEVAVATFACEEGAGNEVSTSVSLVGNLGNPAVAVVVDVDGTSFTPEIGGPVSLRVPCGACPPLKLSLAPAGENAIAVILDSDVDQEVSGFQFGIRHDKNSIRVKDIVPGSAFANAGINILQEGFWGLLVIDGQGATLGCAVDLEETGGTFLTLPACTAGQQVAIVTFECVPGAASGDVTASISLAGDLGDPVIKAVVDVDGTSLYPAIGGPVSVTLSCGAVEVPFIRGETNQDGALTVSDAVVIAKAVFGVGSKYPLVQKCEDAADTNDDGRVTTSDAVFLLHYLFLAGPRMGPPVGQCGPDPTADLLTCIEYLCP